MNWRSKVRCGFHSVSFHGTDLLLQAPIFTQLTFYCRAPIFTQLAFYCRAPIFTQITFYCRALFSKLTCHCRAPVCTQLMFTSTPLSGGLFTESYPKWQKRVQNAGRISFTPRSFVPIVTKYISTHWNYVDNVHAKFHLKLAKNCEYYGWTSIYVSCTRSSYR